MSCTMQRNGERPGCHHHQRSDWPGWLSLSIAVYVNWVWLLGVSGPLAGDGVSRSPLSRISAFGQLLGLYMCSRAYNTMHGACMERYYAQTLSNLGIIIQKAWTQFMTGKGTSLTKTKKVTPQNTYQTSLNPLHSSYNPPPDHPIADTRQQSQRQRTAIWWRQRPSLRKTLYWIPSCGTVALAIGGRLLGRWQLTRSTRGGTRWRVWRVCMSKGIVRSSTQGNLPGSGSIYYQHDLSHQEQNIAMDKKK